MLNELTGRVTQFAIDQGKGTLTEVASVGSVPPEAGLVPGVAQAPAGTAPTAAAPKDDRPKVWAADIQLTPNGKFLYSTERTLSKIALFTVAPGTGKLTYVTNFPTEKQPRGIKIDPSGTWLVAAGEKSDRLAVYRIDADSGRLTETGRFPVGNGANWVEIVETLVAPLTRSAEWRMANREWKQPFAPPHSPFAITEQLRSAVRSACA